MRPDPAALVYAFPGSHGGGSPRIHTMGSRVSDQISSALNVRDLGWLRVMVRGCLRTNAFRRVCVRRRGEQAPAAVEHRRPQRLRPPFECTRQAGRSHCVDFSTVSGSGKKLKYARRNRRMGDGGGNSIGISRLISINGLENMFAPPPQEPRWYRLIVFFVLMAGRVHELLL